MWWAAHFFMLRLSERRRRVCVVCHGYFEHPPNLASRPVLVITSHLLLSDLSCGVNMKYGACCERGHVLLIYVKDQQLNTEEQFESVHFKGEVF